MNIVSNPAPHWKWQPLSGNLALLRKNTATTAHGHAVVTTDPQKSVLRDFADTHGLRSFSIPSDIGGRFSVLTPVGLLPLAVAGEEPSRFISGAAAQLSRGREDALRYAAARRLLYADGKKIELCAFFEPRLRNLGEWWKQLFGESECKNGTGIFPAGTVFTTDLHSIASARRRERTFERSCASTRRRMPVPETGYTATDWTGSAGMISPTSAAARGCRKQAHIAGGVTVVDLVAGSSAVNLGAASHVLNGLAVLCGVLGQNPVWDQPGVEVYKRG